MIKRWKELLGATAAIVFVTAMGVPFFFNPVAAADASFVEVHPVVGFLVYVVLSIALFDWLARTIGSPYRAAIAIVVSQFILVNIDMVLSGKRGIVTAGASAALMATTWICVAFAYAKLSGFSKKMSPDKAIEQEL